MVYTCVRCGEQYTSEDLIELQEAGEYFEMGANGKMICPGCWDDLNRMDPEGLMEEMLGTEGA